MSIHENQAETGVFSNLRNLFALLFTVIFGFFRVIWALVKGVVMLTATFLLSLIGVNIKAAVIDSVLKDKKGE